MTVIGKETTQWGVNPDAARVHRDALVWDDHAGFAPYPDLDLRFLERWLLSGASYLSVNVGWGVMTWDQTLRCAAHYRRWIETHADSYVLAERITDIRRAKKERKLAIAFDLEGADSLNKNVDLVSVYYQIGVRQMNLAYNKNSDYAGGCMDVDAPLSVLGRQVVTEMNRVGMVVDCSHTGYSSSMEIMELSNKPVIFSHANPKALWDHPRNIKDDQIIACARTGGVIGVNGASAFLADNDCSPAAIAKNIKYIADLVGVNHVGIGIDSVIDPDEVVKFSKIYPECWPNVTLAEQQKKVFAQPEQLPRLTEELLHSFVEDDVMNILGGNFERVAAQIWR
ncbi:membrane dipeptidase [Mesorhizobium sp. VK25A]|uniref:Membrane dipeptidase n=1 Tax=Mesorhizobium vachelliae TaxID=3072309 RepID=A0ABU5AF84_9HYPH|nr:MULTISPECIES: membrane dipeptidase [unclassified Mesorhizobium]MDX8535918.1 membrane dipeptidase [Mesorhizobium sp. VK25D]MDX8548674.1 membrane dipeptidase [Mesorhizobium sp. VK25A]